MNKSPTIYLDNAATTYPKPEIVYSSSDTFYRSLGANPGRGQSPMARQAAAMVGDVRRKVAGWLGAPGPDAVVFAPSATIALNQAILGTPLRSGDYVYVSPFEHNSILRPVEHMRRTLGVEVCVLPADSGRLEIPLDRVESQFRLRPPALIAISQISNVCGALLPVRDIARLARAVNPDVVVVVDAAQGAGLYPLKIADALIDYVIFSGHKSLYGPLGVGGFVLASSRRPEPILFGGTGTDSESLEMPEAAPSRYESGSLNVWAIAGLGAAVDWLQTTGREAIVSHGRELTEAIIGELKRIPDVRIHSPGDEHRTSIISFAVRSVRPQAIEALLGTAGISVRAGLHCAPWCHRLLGTLDEGGTVRVSPGYFNDYSDVEMLVRAVKPVAVG